MTRRDYNIFSYKTFQAVSLLVGTIVGAGILGIPYVVAQAGFGIGAVYIIGAGIIFLFINLMMGELVARTEKPSQFVGLSEKYLGAWGKRVSVFMLFLSAYGAMVAYMIGEGEVLSALFSSNLGGTAFRWSLIFFIAGALLLAGRIHSIATFEFICTLVIFIIVMFVAVTGVSHITLPNLATYNWANLFIPFGVVLFAYEGATAIPQMEELLPKEPRKMRRAIIIGSLLPIILYLIFAMVVVGITGASTTEVATVGLGTAVGQWMIIVGNLFAFFTMSTSFIMMGFILKRTFEWDWGMSSGIAWLATILPPLVVFFIGARSFIGVLSLVGGVFGTVMTILIVISFWRAKNIGDIKSKVFNMKNGVLIGTLLIAFFIIGMILTINS